LFFFKIDNSQCMNVLLSCTILEISWMSLSLHLSLCLLSPANPSFSGMHKVRKFYYCSKLMDAHVQILGPPIQLMGCFEVYPSICWVFVFKIWMLGKWFNQCLYIILFFWVLICLFVSQGFISLWNVKKQFISLIFKMKFVW
jgi:hypothetical protein